MPKNRGAQVKVFVPLEKFKYGWRCNQVKHTAIGAAFGMSLAADETGVTYGANSPKPPIATSKTVSSFCDPDKTDDLKKAGYIVNAGGRKRGVRLVGKAITVFVDTPIGYKYAWNMFAADVPEAIKAGVQAAAAGEKDLVWGSFPKPPRAFISLGDGKGNFSTFVPPTSAGVTAAAAAGFTVEGIDPDWGEAVATP